MLQDKLKDLSHNLTDFNLEDYFPSPESLLTLESISEDERKQICKGGRESLEEGVPPLPAALYMECRRFGIRKNYEELFYRRRVLLGRMVKARCFGDESDDLLDGIINMLSAICDEWTWVIPAHNWPNNDSGKALPPLDPPRVDLMAANTASLMALSIHYLRKPLMAEAELLIERVERECRRRCIDPYMQNNEHWWMGYRNFEEHGELNNWTPWITDNFLHCLLFLNPDQEELKAAAQRSSEILNHYLDVLPGDGGCDEGAIYWDHAVGSLFGCLDAMELMSGGSLNLMDDQFLKKAASYITQVHVANSHYANFADCPGVLEHMPFGLMFRMGEILGDKELSSLASELGSESPAGFGIEEAFSVQRDFRNYLFPMTKTSVSKGDRWKVYPETQVYLKKSGDLFFSCKGGHNAESHNHNDIGQFMVYWKGQPALIDPGVGEYTMNTFNDKRYTIWTMQSGWHNLPVINGVEQKEGPEFQSSSFITDNENCRVGIEKSYPKAAGVKIWNRSFELADDEVCLRDSWEMKSDENSVSWHFLSLEEPVLTSGFITIPLPQGHVVVSFPGELLEGSLDYQSIAEDDSKMRVWGKDRIWRTSLNNIKPLAAAGTIQFNIKGE